jgi:hypothetical protein
MGKVKKKKTEILNVICQCQDPLESSNNDVEAYVTGGCVRKHKHVFSYC